MRGGASTHGDVLNVHTGCVLNVHTVRRVGKGGQCEGDGDVVGVVTPLRGVAQVVLHGVQVVEVGVRLRVHQDRGVEEDGERQVVVEREEGEVKERRSCMTMG